MDMNTYKQNILNFLEHKLEKGELESVWYKPTPSLLHKKLNAYLNSENHQKENDLRMIKEFLNIQDNQDIGKALLKLDKDKYLPIKNFIEGKTINPNYIYVEILAILINYNPRPFSALNFPINSDNYTKNNEEKSLLNITDNTNEKTSQKGIKLNAFLGGLVLLFGSTFWIIAKPNKECMYWDINQYIACKCKTQIANKEVIALDEFKLQNFKRIENYKNINVEEISNLWYTKINRDSIDVFTLQGAHPINNKDLKRVTPYIYKKYIVKEPNSI